MSLFTGPGRNSEMSMMMSSNVCGPNLPTSSRCPGDSIWNMPSVRVLRISSNVGRVVARDRVDVDRLAVDPGHLVDGVRDRRLHPDAQQVELEQPELLDVVLVELAHRIAEVAALHRGAVQQRGVGQQHPARVQRDVPGQPVEPGDEVEEQVEIAGAAAALGAEPAGPQLRQVLERGVHLVGPDVREGLGDGVDLGRRQAERGADVADGVPDPVGVHHRDAADPVGAEAVDDRVVDLHAPGGLHVDVDVGQLVAQRGEEALHQQPVAERVDVGDAQQVGDQAAGTRPAGRGANPQALDEVDHVGHGEEVGRVAEGVDDRQLLVQPLPHPLRRRQCRAGPCPASQRARSTCDGPIPRSAGVVTTSSSG